MTAQIQQIPRSAIFESPNNYRKSFNLASLQEMAETMREVGVQQPLKVRPLPMLPEAEHLTYEIVFGHRRFRASGMAGLEFLPCMVEELTDEQADKIRLIENIQREDVSPMEEADGLVRLAEEFNVSAEELGKLVGIGRTSVYDRFKLAKAHPKVREQCEAGAFGSEIAITLAKLPVSIQPTAMRKIMTQQPDPDKGPQGTKMIFMSTREAKEKLRGSFTHSLAEGGFDIENPMLGDAGPCTACGKCSDNVEALLKDFGPGLCIDVDCYETKQVEYVNYRIDQAKRFGAPVIEGEAALKLLPSQWQSYISGNEYERVEQIRHFLPDTDGESKWFKYDDLVRLSGQPEPTLTLMRNPHNNKSVIELLTAEQVEALEAFLPQQQATATAGAPIKPIRKTPPHEAAVDDHMSWQRIKREIMQVAAKGERTVDQLRMIVLALTENIDDVAEPIAEIMGWPEDELPTRYGEVTSFYAKRVTTMDGAELSKLAVLLAIDQAPFHDGHDDEVADEDDASPDWTVTSKLQLAAAYGIDVIEAGMAPPAPPPAPAPAPASASASASASAPTLAPPPAADGGNMDLDLGEPDPQYNAQPALKTLAGKQKVKYRNPATGETWSGRGLQPKWVAAALASGKKLEDFEAGRIKPYDDDAPDDAGLAEADEAARA